jgi:hypothetical protein
MQDTPNPEEIIGAVTRFLRETVMNELGGHSRFLARVAANALDLVNRQIALEGPADAAELARLKGLVGSDGSLLDLNAALCEAIETRRIGLETPGLAEHLWATTLAKLAVDQPSYAAYRRAISGGESI